MAPCGVQFGSSPLFLGFNYFVAEYQGYLALVSLRQTSLCLISLLAGQGGPEPMMLASVV